MIDVFVKFLASKICADLFLFNKNAPLLEIMRNCPKVPIIFGMYTSAFVHYAIQQTHVLNPIFRYLFFLGNSLVIHLNSLITELKCNSKIEEAEKLEIFFFQGRGTVLVVYNNPKRS